MTRWWKGDPTECYWCEITNRPDIGGDLKCPQRRENGAVDWSDSLLNEVMPGDIVFHYSTNANEFVGASVAGGPLESRDLDWRARGTSGRAKQDEPTPTRPGWWLPLFAFRPATNALTLKQLQAPTEQAWITQWTESQRESGTVASPFQLYSVGHAIRQAVGQLHEYRYFIGPRDAALWVLLEQEPGAELQRYVENELSLLLLSRSDGVVHGAAATYRRLVHAGVRL